MASVSSWPSFLCVSVFTELGNEGVGRGQGRLPGGGDHRTTGFVSFHVTQHDPENTTVI